MANSNATTPTAENRQAAVFADADNNGAGAKLLNRDDTPEFLAEFQRAKELAEHYGYRLIDHRHLDQGFTLLRDHDTVIDALELREMLEWLSTNGDKRALDYAQSCLLGIQELCSLLKRSEEHDGLSSLAGLIKREATRAADELQRIGDV